MRIGTRAERMRRLAPRSSNLKHSWPSWNSHCSSPSTTMAILLQWRNRWLDRRPTITIPIHWYTVRSRQKPLYWLIYQLKLAYLVFSLIHLLIYSRLVVTIHLHHPHRSRWQQRRQWWRRALRRLARWLLRREIAPRYHALDLGCPSTHWGQRRWFALNQIDHK